MSKAVLVMDMPSSCDMCDFVQKNNMVGFMTCMNPTSEVYECDVSDYIGCRSDGCPLRELPEKAEVSDCGELCDTDDWYDSGYADGYNACIDELLGEEHG